MKCPNRDTREILHAIYFGRESQQRFPWRIPAAIWFQSRIPADIRLKGEIWTTWFDYIFPSNFSLNNSIHQWSYLAWFSSRTPNKKTQFYYLKPRRDIYLIIINTVKLSNFRHHHQHRSVIESSSKILASCAVTYVSVGGWLLEKLNPNQQRVSWGRDDSRDLIPLCTTEAFSHQSIRCDSFAKVVVTVAEK